TRAPLVRGVAAAWSDKGSGMSGLSRPFGADPHAALALSFTLPPGRTFNSGSKTSDQGHRRFFARKGAAAGQKAS
ncbi:MAG: hypothetical protein RBR06_11725, partial [Desulfuromonadaceae bacterium]|nr:hypothetical protein [Desulfuromonadaceae bacterium]